MNQTTKPFYKWAKQELVEYFRKLSLRERWKLFVALTVGVISIPFILWPAWVLRPQSQAEMKELRSNTEFAQVQIRSEPQLLEQDKEYVAFIQDTRSRLFTEIEIQRLLGILTELGQKSKVSLLSSQPQSDSTLIPAPFDKKYHTLSYLITVEGDYHALATFVGEIEDYPKILRVDEFSVIPQQEKATVHTGEIRLSAYSVKE